MSDLTDPRVIKLKGVLFFVMGVLSSFLLLAKNFSLKNFLLLGVAIWSFARFYYFAFYVIERYIDPAFRFSGLFSAIRYLLKQKRGVGEKV